MSAGDTADIKIVREGLLKKQRHPKKPYDDRWFILTEGTLFYYKNAKDLDPAGSMNLKKAKIGVNKASKKSELVISSGDRKIIVRAKDESRKKEWMNDIKAQIGKDKTAAPKRIIAKKKTNIGRGMKEKAATSTLGKKLLKKLLPKEVFQLLSHLKDFNTIVAGKERAKQIDSDILRICAKMATLFDSKKIGAKDFSPVILPVLMLWSSFTDMVQSSFARDAPALQAHIKDVNDKLSKLLKQHLQPKSVQRLNDIFSLLASSETIEKLFSEDDEIEKFREAVTKILGTLWNTKVSKDDQRLVLKLQTEDYKPGDDVKAHVSSLGKG